MGTFVIQQTADAELLRSSSIPARPIPRARRFMPENPVQPVAMLAADRRICLRLPFAVAAPPWIITAFGHAAMLPGEDQTVRTVVQLRLAPYALPITIAVRHVADDA